MPGIGNGCLSLRDKRSVDKRNARILITRRMPTSEAEDRWSVFCGGVCRAQKARGGIKTSLFASLTPMVEHVLRAELAWLA